MMNKLFFLLLAWVVSFQLANAQSPENVDRVCLKTLEGFLSVNRGEFQVDYTMLPNANSQSISTHYDYLYVAKNEKTGMSLVFSNDKQVISKKYVLRPFRIGCRWNECIFVFKSYEMDSPEIGYGMETIYAYGILQNICDSIISLTEDGYVFKLRDMYYYSTYKGTTPGQTSQIVWLERKVYNTTDSIWLPQDDLNRLSAGDILHCSADKDESRIHYYYLYQDEYMPYTVLIVDGEVVELLGEYADEDLRFKYSYDGKHWMAVANNRFWVDGEMKYVGNYSISDFLISNKGDYYYKAIKEGEENKGEILVANGKIIRRQVRIGHFDLDAGQELRFHFIANGQWYKYENGQIVSLAEEFKTVFYADDKASNLVIDKFSTDGMHKLTYVDGKEGVEIDGVKMTESVPFQVVFDKNSNCFRWNAIEVNKEGKTDLVLYKYNIANNFFKNVFR